MKEATTSLAQCVRIKRGLFFVPHAAIFAVVRRSGAESQFESPDGATVNPRGLALSGMLRSYFLTARA
jgi:hypothetical protein